MSAIALLCSMVGSVAIPNALAAQAAWAEPSAGGALATPGNLIAPNLIAQNIVEGLPPPPAGPFLPSPNPAAEAAQPGLQSASTGQRYMVIVNGASRSLLAHVRRVESGASLQEYQGRRVIQVALLGDVDRAEQQVRALASRGIEAKIVPIAEAAAPSVTAPALMPASAQSPQPSPALRASPQSFPAPSDLPPAEMPLQPVPREVEFGQQAAPQQTPQAPLSQFPSPPELPSAASPVLPSASTGDGGNSAPGTSASVQPSDPPRGSRAYYVIIPGKQGDLSGISNQVIRLGDGFGIAQLVQQSSSPRGPHVQVGPFANRDAARRWNRYFRDFGMDARIDLIR